MKVFTALLSISLVGVCYGQAGIQASGSIQGSGLSGSGSIQASGSITRPRPIDISAINAGISASRQTVLSGIRQAQQTASGALSGMREAGSAIAGVKSNMLQQGVTGFQQGLGLAANAAANIPVIGSMISQRLQAGAQAAGNVGAAMQNKLGVVTGMKANAINALESSIDKGLSAFEAGAEFGFGLAQNKAEAIANGLNVLSELAGSFAASGQQAVAGAIQQGQAAIEGGIQAGINAASTGIQAASNAASAGMEAGISAANTGINAATDAVKTGINAATTGIQGAATLQGSISGSRGSAGGSVTLG